MHAGTDACCSRDLDACYVFQNFSEVLVRQLTNIFGLDDLHQVRSIALLIQRTLQSTSYAGDDNNVVCVIGDGAMTATGSVITRDVPDGAMAVARVKQDNKPNFATKFFARLRAAKAAKQKG